MRLAGIIFLFWGFIGCWKLLEDFTGYAWINTISKDQVTIAIGITWYFLAAKKSP